MSTSIITDADIPSLTRVGTIDNGSDSGTGMVVNILSFATQSNPAFYGGPNLEQFLFCGVRNIYQVGGDVDFDHITTDIPAAAKITKVEITALASYHSQSDTQATADNFPTGSVDGYSKAECGISIENDNVATTPNTTVSIAATDQNVNGAPVANFNLTANVNNLGTIITKVYDIQGDPGQYPLGYITRATLVAQFASQKLLFKGATIIAVGAARGDVVINSSGVSNFTRDYSVLFNANVSLWTMTVTWSPPVTWTLENTSPVQAGDQITVTSSGPDALDPTQLLTVDLVSPSGTISVPPINWITITLNLFIFVLPTLTGDPPIFEIVVTSTQFTGSVTLGKLATIFLTNATGIYTLVPGKTNDTLYDNTNGGDPVDVAIPNPFGDTGFIGG